MISPTSGSGTPPGGLERAVLEALWAAPAPLAATDLQAALADRELALTTVHTVLSRLTRKSLVAHDGGRPRRFRAVGSREERAAELMREILGGAADREAVLARFVDTVSTDEAELLRRLLDES